VRVSAIALAGFVLVHSADDPFAEWMGSLMRPDFAGPCCGPADQYYPDSYMENADGSFEAMVGAADVHVPAVKVIWDRVNPTGRGVLFVSRDPAVSREGFVFCFVPASGV